MRGKAGTRAKSDSLFSEARSEKALFREAKRSALKREAKKRFSKRKSAFFLFALLRQLGPSATQKKTKPIKEELKEAIKH